MKPLLLRTLSGVALGLLALSHAAPAQTIPAGNIVVDLERFAVLPNSGNNQPARANVLRPAPGGRLFVNDQRGTLYTVGADGTGVTAFLNLTTYVPVLNDNGERGFQSFAFHPDFATPGAAGYGRFYTMQSQSDTSATPTFTPGVSGAGRSHDEVLLEWAVADPAAGVFAPADPAQPFREILRIVRPASNHNAGYVSFNPTAGTGPDRLNLYIGTGDSGGGGDPLRLAQALGNIYGAVLRINPLPPSITGGTASANGRYTIPADNPYTTNPAFAREKFAAGFRNPQRFTWDPANGNLFIADIGQGTWEEISLGRAGANYGWNLREGSYVYNSDGSVGANSRGDAATTGLTYPIAEYRHFSGGNGVTTGPVYRGQGVPELNGRLIFSDFVNGIPYTIDANNLPNGGQDPITQLRLREDGQELSFLAMVQRVNAAATRADLRFGSDAQGRVYFLDKQDGVIRRVMERVIVPGPGVVSALATTLSISRAAGETGVVQLTRTGDVSGPINVVYSVSGGLINGQDFVFLKGNKKFKAGASTATVKVRPLPGGANGKVKIIVQPGDGYTPDAATRKAKVKITE